LQALICAYIRSGAFPQIAAEAAGIPQKVFERWMRYGQAKRPLPLYRDFAQAVRQAQAQARLLAENHALKDDPLTWLKSGPGKETARMPGWTSPIKPATPKRKNNGLSSQRFMDFITCLLTALEPFPEARLAAADALERGGWMADPEQPEMPEQAEAVVVSAEPATQREALSEPARDALPESLPLSSSPAASAGSAATSVETRSGKPQGTETKTQPKRIETTTNKQATVNEPAAKPASGAAATPRNGPSAWDPLDARHWIVFSSS
jgi:hypothetical protein